MVGGKVVETIELEDKIWINCEDEKTPQWNDKNYSNDQCAIYVEKTAAARCIQEGDSLWWQGDHAMWTPRKRAFTDFKLKKIGSSGVKRPKAKKEEVEETPVK